MSLPWGKAIFFGFGCGLPLCSLNWLFARRARARHFCYQSVGAGCWRAPDLSLSGWGGGGGGEGGRLRHTALAGLAGRRGRGGRGRTRGGGGGAARAVEGVSRGGCLLGGGARVRAHTRSKIAPRHDGRHARRRQRHQRGRRAGAVGAAERGRVAGSVVVWAAWRWLLAAAVLPPLPLQPRVPRRRPSM